jgi:hypothetical protein
LRGPLIVPKAGRNCLLLQFVDPPYLVRQVKAASVSY